MAKAAKVWKRFFQNTWNTIVVAAPGVFLVATVIGLIFALLQLKIVIAVGAVIGFLLAWLVSMWYKAKEDLRKEKQETMDIIKNSK